MMSAAQIRKAWQRIERWCRTNDPQVFRELSPGASKKQIDDVEATIGRALPEDVQISLSIHNGQRPASLKGPAFFFVRDVRFLSCEDIVRDYSGWRNSSLRNSPVIEQVFLFYPEHAIQHHHFNDGWIPMATPEGSGNYLAVDLAPGRSGAKGQIIDFGRSVRIPGVMNSSWGEFLSSYADLLDIMMEINNDPNDCYAAINRVLDGCDYLDAMVLWARDGRWPIVRFDPAWRTSSVMALATEVSKTRNFSAMPILADALEDAGCGAEAVLNHCRDRGCTHSKGCWVIDTLLSGNVTEPRWCHRD
jgi:cell wall assembly regulator SMI1